MEKAIGMIIAILALLLTWLKMRSFWRDNGSDPSWNTLIGAFLGRLIPSIIIAGLLVYGIYLLFTGQLDDALSQLF